MHSGDIKDIAMHSGDIEDIGEKVRLACRVAGQPAPRVDWFRWMIGVVIKWMIRVY